MHRNININISNGLSLLRLLSAPVIFWLILTDRKETGAFLFLLALLTDFLDGYLARKYQQVTALGTHLDRWADKILVGATLLGILWQAQLWTGMMVWAIFVLALVVGYGISLRSKVRVTVTALGRTVLGLEGILLLLMLMDKVNYPRIALFFVLAALPALDYLRKLVAHKTIQ